MLVSGRDLRLIFDSIRCPTIGGTWIAHWFDRIHLNLIDFWGRRYRDGNGRSIFPAVTQDPGQTSRAEDRPPALRRRVKTNPRMAHCNSEASTQTKALFRRGVGDAGSRRAGEARITPFCTLLWVAWIERVAGAGFGTRLGGSKPVC